MLENVLMDDDNNKVLEILKTVEELLEDNTGVWSSPQLTQLLLDKLLMLCKWERKEVRIGPSGVCAPAQRSGH